MRNGSKAHRVASPKLISLVVCTIVTSIIFAGVRSTLAADAEDVVIDDFSPGSVITNPNNRPAGEPGAGNSKSKLCCVCNYNGDPRCDALGKFIPEDCVWDPAQKKYRNRWQRNCEELEVPKVCEVFVRNDIQSKVPIDSIVKRNSCTGYYEWNYVHGHRSMCPEYFERLYCIAATGVNGHIFMSSCLIFEDQQAVEAEMKKLAERIKAECLDVTVSITATPHIQSIATYGFPLTCSDPTGTGMNHPMTVEVKPDGRCKLKFPNCADVYGKPCQGSQQGNVLRCLLEGQRQEYVCSWNGQGYQWAVPARAVPQSPQPPARGGTPYRRR